MTSSLELLRRLVAIPDGPFDDVQGHCMWCGGGWEQVPGPRGGKGKYTHTGRHEDDCPYGEAERLVAKGES